MLSFTALACAVGVGYEREAALLGYCNKIGFAASCASQLQLLQGLGTVWVLSAAAVGALMGIELQLVRRFRSLTVPAGALLAYAVFLVGLGVTGLVASQPEGYGQIPHGTVETLFYTYMTGALFLFALTFLGRRPRIDSLSRSVVLVGVAHGIIGMIMAAVFAFFVLFPPVVST